MSVFQRLTALIPFGKKEIVPEYFFALNIGQEQLTAALWSIEDKELKILSTASDNYSSNAGIVGVTDKLLDEVLGEAAVEPKKILFGVPGHFLQDEDLREEYLKLLRNIVKELELEPMAYVATSHALLHFLEKKEGVPTTAILVGFDAKYLEVTVARAGKLDGTKVVERGENSGADIEKALLQFIDVETLPSKILIYGEDQDELEKLKAHLLSFTWMSKLSFLHFPKIETLEDEVVVKSICLAGASEIQSEVYYVPTVQETKKEVVTKMPKEAPEEPAEISKEHIEELGEEQIERSVGGNLGFIVGDVSKQEEEEMPANEESEPAQSLAVVEQEDFEPNAGTGRRFIPKLRLKSRRLLIPATLAAALILIYLFLPRAEVKIFVEPKVLEKDTQVVADPAVSAVNEESKIIPGQSIETEVSGSSKDLSSGKKTVGDSAKGTVKIINNSADAQTLSKGTAISSNGLKFTLDTTVNIASTSATADTKSTATASVTAVVAGADGNLASGTQFSSANSGVAIVAEGNFSGGTSKEVTVVSEADQKRLLASLASDLRRQAKQKLQEKLPGKKILEEALTEEIVKKSYNKNINDQAGEFSLDLTIKFKGTAFEEKDLKQIVGKLVTTQVPEGYQLDLASTETQTDVSKLEKDGKLIFLARFKAKLMPQIDEGEIKSKIAGRSVAKVGEILKSYENVLGSEIKLVPALPGFLARVPILERNIKIEVGLK
ncbi:baseplate J/gp47 family protein [Candidatus Daviesbacteria bacterium]|nr:baseplate J/gp47 family protein [Candidatus Daviesbacteria bacterium]